jgi:hypothetical protein
MSGADWIQQEQMLEQEWEIERQRLLDNIEIVTESGCWIWMRHLNGDGYGNIRIRGPKEKVHRAAYRIFVGELPPGLVVCHHCDVRCCVNPSHLFLGTQKENVQDMLRKHGTRITRRKLTDDQVREIRRAVGPIKELGKKYGVHPTIISKIRTGNKWWFVT